MKRGFAAMQRAERAERLADGLELLFRFFLWCGTIIAVALIFYRLITLLCGFVAAVAAAWFIKALVGHFRAESISFYRQAAQETINQPISSKNN